MVQLMSRWGKEADKNNVHAEYPRPTLVRDSYFNLNGVWQYCINEQEDIPLAKQTVPLWKQEMGMPSDGVDGSAAESSEAWKQEAGNICDGDILVPFSPETKLSGVERVLLPGQYLHYKKSFVLPDDFCRGRVILHFGAVDQECRVFLNGKKLGSHVGGYLAFSFDVTDALCEGENVLTLCVKDDTEHAPHARGKQKLVKKGKMSSLFYTPQSGIWKTVWMESVPAAYIKGVKLTPLYDEKAVAVQVHTNVKEGTAHVTVLDGETVVAETDLLVRKEQKIELGSFLPWTPEQPHLYDVKIRFAEDEVRSYFGMRKLSTGKDKHGILRFFLNNEPFFFNGVLDQGYWPESLLTPPADEALKYDIVKLKEYGFNTIRKHIKIESERFYYHCDRLGMIVWQDMPNGGGDYNMLFVTYLPNAFNRFARGVKDHHYRAFRREDEQGRKQYYDDLKGMVRQLYNHPSIAVWVPFNEGWGQFDAAKATKTIRGLDQTRLINEACGWFDQKGGDMYSIHNYLRKLSVKPQTDRVVALTEYGGYAYAIKGHLACEKEFGYQTYKSKEELTEHYKRLWEEQIYPNVERGLCSAIYTQTSDIEEEVNGIMTYDREVDKLTLREVQELNQRLYELFREVAM